MVVDVITHEGRNEVVGVVVEWLHPQGDGVARLVSRGREVLRFELSVQKRVARSLIKSIKDHS